MIKGGLKEGCFEICTYIDIFTPKLLFNLEEVVKQFENPLSKIGPYPFNYTIQNI